MRRILFACVNAIWMISCSSIPQPIVLERSDALEEKPSWANIGASAYFENGKHFFVGYVAVPEGASKSAALNMSDEKAYSEPMRSIVREFLDQNQVGESLYQGDSVGQRVISATRGYRPPMPGLQVVRRYWETVSVPVSTEKRKTELRVFSLAEMSDDDFASAKEQALRELRGKSTVQEVLDQVGASQRQSSFDKAKEQ